MKLSQERIVDAGMDVFADAGYDGLSMRGVAKRLDAQAASLYYHVPNKQALLRLMADRVARRAYDAGTAGLDALGPDAPWEDRVAAQASALRASISEHPGGAALLAGSPKLLSPGALSIMERLQRTLDGAGVPERRRAIAADLVLSYVTGYVLQEQADSGPHGLEAGAIAALAQRFPMTFAGSGADDDAAFAASVAVLCAGIATLRATC